jgi:ribosome maturation factor RimP
MEKSLTAKVCELITPVVEALGYQLWGCELKGLGKHTLLRIYIDSETGVSLDDCAKVSNQISGVLDVEDLIMGRYDLEVSSPGIDRPLFKAEHYRRFIGYTVRIKLYAAQNGQRNFMGEIKDVTEDEVTIIVDDRMMVFPIRNIEKAKVVPKI